MYKRQTKALKSIILKTIQETCHYVSSNEQEFVYSLQEESAMKDIAASETVKNRIERNQKRVHELDKMCIRDRCKQDRLDAWGSLRVAFT